jgi:uncharacterized membrane protein YhaH (DUF805 family)
MAMRLAEFFRWDGETDRKTYALVGLTGVAIKFNVDRIVAWYFHKSVLFSFYWAPLGSTARLGLLTGNDSTFLSILLLVSIPFLWIGLAMTVRRLRDAGQPVWLAGLFFVPFVNLLFFLALCVLPKGERAPANEGAPWPGPNTLDGLIPRSKLGSAVASIAATTVMGLLFVLLGTEVIGAYGWSLFVALPFCLGLFSVLTYSYHEPRNFGSCMSVAVLPVALLGAVLLVVALEGIICILMAAPLALILAVLGGSLGYSIQAKHWRPQQSAGMISAVLFLTPALFGVEHAAALRPEIFVVHSSVEINAPPQAVWNKVVAFTEIGAPQEILFRAGIAYPIRAEMIGHGAGAVRLCVFSTGPFVEPIQVWDEPRLLKFSVSENPAPMNELSPYSNLRPPHLHGYFVSKQGQFELVALPGGRTRVIGTTWYQHTMWPAGYWHLWSDYIIHRIHMRVLEHIRDEAEGPAVSSGRWRERLSWSGGDGVAQCMERRFGLQIGVEWQRTLRDTVLARTETVEPGVAVGEPPS